MRVHCDATQLPRVFLSAQHVLFYTLICYGAIQLPCGSCCRAVKEDRQRRRRRNTATGSNDSIRNSVSTVPHVYELHSLCSLPVFGLSPPPPLYRQAIAPVTGSEEERDDMRDLLLDLSRLSCAPCRDCWTSGSLFSKPCRRRAMPCSNCRRSVPSCRPSGRLCSASLQGCVADKPSRGVRELRDAGVGSLLLSVTCHPHVPRGGDV